MHDTCMNIPSFDFTGDECVSELSTRRADLGGLGTLLSHSIGGDSMCGFGANFTAVSNFNGSLAGCKVFCGGNTRTTENTSGCAGLHSSLICVSDGCGTKLWETSAAGGVTKGG